MKNIKLKHMEWQLSPFLMSIHLSSWHEDLYSSSNERKNEILREIWAFCIKNKEETSKHKKIRKKKKIRLQREENPFGGDFHSSVCSRQTERTRLGSALAASCLAFFAHFAPLLFLKFGLVRIAGCYLKTYQVSFLAGMGKKDDPKLMQEWFKLVQEKNALVRYESELMIL